MKKHILLAAAIMVIAVLVLICCQPAKDMPQPQTITEPTIVQESQKDARWLGYDDTGRIGVTCPLCGSWFDFLNIEGRMNYCPDGGEKMYE